VTASCTAPSDDGRPVHISPQTQPAWPGWTHAAVAANQLSVPASELENRVGTQQQHSQSTVRYTELAPIGSKIFGR